ncbi:MAG: FIG215594: Membrane spanning protein [uncultured Nocardioidaceae bacterium]|uniref:FIG215594: Membrane spanning protein n=1 Tax=uncultured Nocardioidaceae bacterium TaxID=253824 RepID=A0A6J4MPQ6_9ACTN|nr:MAG: FIG215594: Membrane spanning protein [uncultured Nocardioidaceae bacterium]
MDGSGTHRKPGARAVRSSLTHRLVRLRGPLGGPLRGSSGADGGGTPTRGRSLGWRLATPVAFLGAGALLVTSGVNSAGTDLRPSQYADLADLAQQETDRVAGLQDRVAELTAEIEELSGELDSGTMDQVQADIDALSGPAGLTAMKGPGLTVTLEDAPEAIRDSVSDENVRDTIVHQQDIQAVVNAMWAGGAEAMTLQGQRVVSTTGIKCVGNTVLLHGVTYSPPYVISAVGDPDVMRESIESSPYIQAYLDAVEQWRVGWDVEVEESIEAPAYAGTTDMRYARATANGSDGS